MGGVQHLMAFAARTARSSAKGLEHCKQLCGWRVAAASGHRLRVFGMLRPSAGSNGPIPSQRPSRRMLHRSVSAVRCARRHADAHIAEPFLSSSPPHFSRGRSQVSAETVSTAQSARLKWMSVSRLCLLRGSRDVCWAVSVCWAVGRLKLTRRAGLSGVLVWPAGVA